MPEAMFAWADWLQFQYGGFVNWANCGLKVIVLINNYNTQKI